MTTIMGLIQLPEELIIMIIQQLDTQSIHNLYNTCGLLKNIISITGIVKECKMSMNNLATVRSLKTDFFKAIAPHLLELNLCGVPDLRKSYLIPAMKKLKSLQALDISFTNLDLIDFLNIYEVCPTIINVSVNFMDSNSGLARMPHESIVQCQDMFKHLRHVHFIGSGSNLLQSKLPLLILCEANLESLKYTIAESDTLHNLHVYEQVEKPMVTFKYFFLSFLNWTTTFSCFGSFLVIPIFKMLDLSSIEFIIINKQNFKQYCIYTTPMFQTFFQENFDVDSDKVYVTEYREACEGNVAVLIWKKEANDFNDAFFAKLKKMMKPFFPCDCQLYNGKSVPEKYDWFYITPQPEDKAYNNCERPPSEFRPKRIAPPMNVLNYDELFKTKKRVQLSLIFDEFLRNPIALPTSCDYLQKLTFLSVTGAVRMSADFFNVMFKNCVNLVTVNIESPSIFPCTIPVSRAVQLSSSLKNLRLTDKRIDFGLLFPSLAKCKTLENVHVEDLTLNENVKIGDPSILIEECPNLYSLYIQAPLNESTRIRKTQILYNAKMSFNKHHLRLVLDVEQDALSVAYIYNPFLSVFNLNPINQL